MHCSAASESGTLQSGHLLEQALPVPLNLIQLRGRDVRRQTAIEGARDRAHDLRASVVRLSEEVLELVHERSHLWVGCRSGRGCCYHRRE